MGFNSAFKGLSVLR